jgi:F-type H+-transporting ATPase subunit b
MRRFMSVGWFAFGACLALGLTVGSSRGADPAEEAGKAKHGAGHEPAKYNVTLHKEDGSEEDVKFDMNKPDDQAKLSRHLAAGEVSHVALDKPPDLLAIRWDLGLWTLVVFLLLLYILKRLAWGPMLEGLQRRETSIRSAIDEAHKAREEAQQLRQQFDKKMAEAEARAQAILDEGRRDAQRVSEELTAKARKEMEDEKTRHTHELELARDQALQQLWSQAADLATLVASKAVGRQMNIDDHRRLTEEALAELNQAASQRNRVGSTV